MYNFLKRFNLQFFADGGAASGDGGDGGSSMGVSSGIPSQDGATAPSLESLGVPKDRAEKYRQRKGITQAQPTQEQPQQNAEQIVTADAQNPKDTEATIKSLKDALKENPNWNKEAQEMITGRVKNLNARLSDVEPILEILGNNYGFDTSDLSKLDLKALADKVTDDSKYYENMAIEMGTDIETAKRIDRREKEAAKAEREAQRTISEQKLRDHYNNLQQQAMNLKATIPNFDLETELQNPTFMRMTSPEGGLTVEQAFHALHFKEINQYNQNQTARNVAQALSNSIQAGRAMPTENGSVMKAPSTVQEKPYSEMNAQERAAFLKQIKGGRRF